MAKRRNKETTSKTPLVPEVPPTGDGHQGGNAEDLGDIEGLAESIRVNGLLHPIVTTPDETLINGYRRLDAVKKQGTRL